MHNRSPALIWKLSVAAAYAATYVFLDWVSYIQPVLQLGITPWNPPAGLTLAFLLIVGPQWAVVTAIAAFAAELLVRGGSAHPAVFLVSSVWIAATYATAARFLHLSETRQAVLNLAFAVRFVAMAAAATLVAAVGYVGIFVVSSTLPIEVAGGSVIRYWVGDLNGVLMLTPLLLAVAAGGMGWHWVRGRVTEIALQFTVLAILIWMMFGTEIPDRLRFFYPLFVPMIWIAVRWGALGSLAAALVIQVGITIGMRNEQVEAPFVDLQILMLTIMLTGLLLGAVVKERIAALRQLASGEAELRAMLAAAPDAVLTTDRAGEIRTSNVSADALFGAENARPADVGAVLPGLALETHQGRQTLLARRSDGSSFPADVAWVGLDPPATPGWLLLVRDATDRERIQHEAQERDRALARAMRFAVAGELASALTHQLNQPITALASYLRACEIMASSSTDLDQRLASTLEKASNEAIRAAQVLHRLRDFYQGGITRNAATDVRASCQSVLELLSGRLSKSDVRIAVEIPGTSVLAAIDRTQLEMVLHNLVTNALDSMQQSDLSQRSLLLATHQSGDGMIVLAVHDAGPGVHEDALPMLFEPFNTTKPDGMGLGLAIGRNLVRACGGEIVYQRSERLGGACFTISLPLANSDEEEEPA